MNTIETIKGCLMSVGGLTRSARSRHGGGRGQISS